MNRFPVIAFLGAVLLTASSSSAVAQPAGASASAASGTITGRVFNPNTGEYVRNAQIRVEETGQTAVSENGGEFRISPVPAGKATLTVTYTGYRTATAVVNVPAGASVAHEFNLISSIDTAAAGETIKLAQFVVSTEREGAA